MDLSYATFRHWNSITGWILFAISSIVYFLTLEPTVSFWDCGEFILSAFKLQVGHPPGAPLFLMMGRIATLFAGDDTPKVALMMNILSGLCSGFAIMFLFWTITHLARKIYERSNSVPANALVIIGAGVIGALSYTFSDTFWFSAVEGELYALSSLVTGLVFWAMLKWEDEADQPSSGRWIILIAYIMGLGIGIHRLNLLVIPVLVFVFYFRKYTVTLKGLIYATIAAVILLWLMVFIIIPGIPRAGGWFELFFVNVLGLPYDSGLLFYMVFFIALLALGIRFSIKKQKPVLNYIFTAMAVILLGFSSYAMIMIRSSARPPMNQNDPSNVFSLIYYINMEQYGTSPKLYGNYYSAPATGVKQVVAGYNKIGGKYVPYYRPEYEFDNQFETVFPRMYSPEPDHENAYRYWGRIEGRKYSISSSSGKRTVVCPTFGENLRFFFRYQVGYMYMRYFMWNFAGRQNDLQGNGNPLHGNWISGIDFIDEARLGSQDAIPDELKTNPARNTYYFLPLILGLLGLYWHYKKQKTGFWLVFSFFFMTGIAIILYLNQYPNQPRERDYAYAGSFYAFSIWMGLGFIFVYDLLRKIIKSNLAAAAGTFVLLLFAVPLLMASQNWDDHDRSDRYTARDIGANYLESTARGGILFTYGDNDSFPLWYIQDVEGVRTDVRVSNLSYIQAGWYIEMMRQKAYESDPLPFSLGPEKYIEGKRTQLPVDDRINKPIPIEQIVEFAGSDDKSAQVDITGRGDYLNFLPVNKFLIDVDTTVVLGNGTVKPYFRDSIVSPMIWDYTESDAFKGDLAIMDMFAANDWKRPLYMSTTVPSSQYKGLEKFFVQEGLAYRIAPVQTGSPEPGEFGMMDPYVMYDNMMNKFRWGNAEKPSVYLDENNRRMFSNFRRLFGNLGKKFLESGDTARALEVVRKGLQIVPPEKMPNDFFSLNFAEVLIRAGMNEEGEKLINEVLDYSAEYLEYIVNLQPELRFGLEYTTGLNMQAILDIYRLSIGLKLDETVKKTELMLDRYYTSLYPGNR
jgi:hypothetical protein